MGGSCCKKKEPQKIAPENPEDPGTFSFRQESERNSPFKSQKKETPPMDQIKTLTAPEIMLATSNSAVINNLIRTMKGSESYRGTLEYPASYKVPRNNSVQQFGVKRKGKWDNFESHKYLDYNIAEQYKQKRYLPQIPDYIPYKTQEAFMTINLLRDDQKNFIEQVLIPLKQRFILEEEGPVIGRKREIRYYSYTFGTVLMNNGPEIINELIGDIMKNNSKVYLNWNPLCQAGAKSILEPYQNELLDDFRIKKIKQQTNLGETLFELGALDVQIANEVIDFKTQAGFEVMLMMLIDDKNPDRRVRRMLLNKDYKYYGLSQIKHKQFDFINCMVLCQDIQGEYYENDKLDATVMQDQLELDDRTIEKLNPTDKFEVSQFKKHKNVDSLTNFSNNQYSATTQKGKQPKWVYKNGKFDMGDSLDAQNTYNELQKARQNLHQNGLYQLDDRHQMSGTREFNIEPDILGEDRLSEY